MRNVAPRAFLLLLLAALGACAAPAQEVAGFAAASPPAPLGKPGTSPRHAADIMGPACAPEHRALIDAARSLASTRVAEAIRLVRTEPGHPHIRRWFGTTPAEEVAMRLERIAGGLAQPDGFKLLCNDPPACQGYRVAYAAPSRRIVGLCPGFFRARADGYDTPWGMLIHEISHIAAGTDDHAYGPQQALILAKADPARAAVNADSYEYFVETLGR